LLAVNRLASVPLDQHATTMPQLHWPRSGSPGDTPTHRLCDTEVGCTLPGHFASVAKNDLRSQTASMPEWCRNVAMRGARSSGGAASPPVTVAGIDALVSSASRRRRCNVRRCRAGQHTHRFPAVNCSRQHARCAECRCPPGSRWLGSERPVSDVAPRRAAAATPRVSLMQCSRWGTPTW